MLDESATEAQDCGECRTADHAEALIEATGLHFHD
jgi:hypothetical protein